MHALLLSTLLVLSADVPTKVKEVFEPLKLVVTLPASCHGSDLMGSFMLTCDGAPPMTSLSIADYSPDLAGHPATPEAAVAVIKRLHGSIGSVTAGARSGDPKGEWSAQARVTPPQGMAYTVIFMRRQMPGRAVFCIGNATDAATVELLLDICRQVQSK